MPVERLDSPAYCQGERICRICERKLRPLTKSKDWDTRVYHVTCFKKLLKDIYRYDTVAFKKYGFKKKIGNKNLKEFVEGTDPIIISFD